MSRSLVKEEKVSRMNWVRGEGREGSQPRKTLQASERTRIECYAQGNRESFDGLSREVK